MHAGGHVKIGRIHELWAECVQLITLIDERVADRPRVPPPPSIPDSRPGGDHVESRPREPRIGDPRSPRPLGKIANSVYRRTVTAPASAAKARHYALLGALRRDSIERTARCAVYPTADRVDVLRGPDGMRVHNIETCGSVWGCPRCSAAIYSRRAQAVTDVVAGWGPNRIYLLTLTLRHAPCDDLSELKRGVSRAWRLLNQGLHRAWRGRVRHLARALEVTVSSDGAPSWHPHLHVLLFCGREQTEEEVAEWQADIERRWERCVIRGMGWIEFEKQRDRRPERSDGREVRELGERYRPIPGRGAVVSQSPEAAYIEKLGLEIAQISSKVGAQARWSPWQLAHNAAMGDERARFLWRHYVVALYGARQLTWSLHAKRGLGYDDKPDRELALEHEAEGELMVRFTRRGWLKRVRRAGWLAALAEWLARQGPPAVS